MGKQYYCDYCERSFADGAENRKKHLVSVHHQKLRKAHYELFKDAASILEDNKLKYPCRKFHSAGYCEFGSSCKYSHLTPMDVKNLEERAQREKCNKNTENPCPELNIETWLQTKKMQISDSSKSTIPAASVKKSILPPVLLNMPNLPLSLIPARAEEFPHKGNNKPQWG